MKLGVYVWGALLSVTVFLRALDASSAPVPGIPVDEFGNLVPHTTTTSPLGILNAIKYFIPLGGSACTFGVSGCGQSADSGTGNVLLSMFLSFTPVNIATGGNFSVIFDDLDLINANDPAGFLESVEVFSGTTSITGLIDTFDGLLVTNTGSGDAADNITELALTIDGSFVASDPLILKLGFLADSSFYGTNTPEYLAAGFDQAGFSPDPVPLPAAFPLFVGGLGLLGLLGWRRRRMAAV